MRIDIVSLFPEYFKWPLSHSILKQAVSRGHVCFHLHNTREFTEDRHRTVDEKPFGGGAGMVLKAEPIFRCVESLPKGWTVLLSPRGNPLTQKVAKRLSRKRHLILVAGHYEGVDERVSRHLVDEEISVGDFVTMGGEAPALCLIESVVRLIPGVLGNANSPKEESFTPTHGGGRPITLEFPQYTRPQTFRGWEVPKVLLSGNHGGIQRWREKERLRVTAERRPDLARNAYKRVKLRRRITKKTYEERLT